MQTRREVAIGLFQDASRATDAVDALKQAGFSATDVSVFVPSGGPASTEAAETARGARSLVAGAIVGGLGGWLVGIRALPIPIVGPFIAAGAAALGAGIGTVVGGLAGMSVSPRARQQLEQDAVVVVRDGDRLHEAERILRKHGASTVEHARDESAISDLAPTPIAP